MMQTQQVVNLGTAVSCSSLLFQMRGTITAYLVGTTN